MNFLQILYWSTAVMVLLGMAGSCYVLSLAIVGFPERFNKRRASTEIVPRTRFLVLVPAHNEEKGILPTLKSILMQDYPSGQRRVIVIADNCQDGTAGVVLEQGVECWERNEPETPGKGRALGWAIDRLRTEEFDAAIFVDADTRLCPGFFSEMDLEIQEGQTAIQARNEFELADSSYFSLLSYASKRAENSLYWRARQRLGLLGFLSGNGFCLKRETLEKYPWSAYSIVEDVEYSLQLTLQGVRTKFLDSAAVHSRATARAREAYPQRLRWASGTLQIIADYAPKLLRASFERRSILLAEAALALMLTSRLFLAYLLLIAGVCSLILAAIGKGILLCIGVLLTILMLAIYAGMVLAEIPAARGGKWKAVVKLPFYLGWISLVQIGAALGNRRAVWGKSSR